MAVASVTKITAASSEGFDAAVREGLARANRTLRGITGLHVIEHKASLSTIRRQPRERLPGRISLTRRGYLTGKGALTSTAA